MSTSGNQQQKSSCIMQPKQHSTLSQRNTLRKWLNLRGALMGLLMLLMLTTSGCVSNLKPSTQLPEINNSVSPQLMVQPRLTQEMLSVLSQ